MTHKEQILLVAGRLDSTGRHEFGRKDIRDALRLSPDEWLQSYTAIFQAMSITLAGLPRFHSDSKTRSGDSDEVCTD